ncbi:Hypothetical predicted protein, partial [Pelobates cultripes]
QAEWSYLARAPAYNQAKPPIIIHHRLLAHRTAHHNIPARQAIGRCLLCSGRKACGRAEAYTSLSCTDRQPLHAFWPPEIPAQSQPFEHNRKRETGTMGRRSQQLPAGTGHNIPDIGTMLQHPTTQAEVHKM